MKRIYHTISFIFLIITCSSCLEKEINYPFDFEGNRIVVTGYINDVEALVHISLSVSPLDRGQLKYPEGLLEVSLFQNDSFSCQLNNIGDFWYKTPEYFIPADTCEYHIEVKSDVYVDVRSTNQSVFPKADFAKLNRFNYYYECSVYDNEEADSYYGVRVLSYFEDTLNDRIRERYYIFPEILQTDEGIGYNELLYMYYNHFEEVDPDSVVLITYHISEDLYRFIKSSSSGGLEYPFEDIPEMGYNNIEGGYGIFGSMTTDTIIYVGEFVNTKSLKMTL